MCCWSAGRPLCILFLCQHTLPVEYTSINEYISTSKHSFTVCRNTSLSGSGSKWVQFTGWKSGIIQTGQTHMHTQLSAVCLWTMGGNTHTKKKTWGSCVLAFRYLGLDSESFWFDSRGTESLTEPWVLWLGLHTSASSLVHVNVFHCADGVKFGWIVLLCVKSKVMKHLEIKPRAVYPGVSSSVASRQESLMHEYVLPVLLCFSQLLNYPVHVCLWKCRFMSALLWTGNIS